MADYVVRMTGQDNLSGTIKQVKSELNDLGKTTSKLDQIDAKFSKITNSTAPLKKQLRDLKTLMAQMNMDGLANTEQYTKIAQEAGKIKDAMDDAAAATKRFSSDTANLDAGVQALQGIVAVGGVATGVMAMFGVENEKVQQAILKVQGALTVLNGVQQVANVLNKDSALIQTLKAARMRVATAAQVSQTAATKAGTLAQLKLNAAVLANPYVLAAAAIAALAAGIVYWVSTMDDATEAQKGVEEAIKTANDATTKGYEAYMKNKMELDQLKTTLDNFNGSKEEERALVDDLNNKYGNTLGKYKDLASWKKALANVSEYQCKLMAAEAKLAALNAEAYSAWAKAMSGENFEENMAKFKKLKEFADDALDDVNFYKKQVSIAINLSGGTRGSGSKGSGSGKSTRTTGGGGSGSSTKEKEATGLIGKLEKKIKDLQTQINEATTEDLIKNLNDQLKNKQKELHELKVRVGLEVDPEIEKKEEAREKIQEQIDQIYSNITPYSPETSSYEKAMAKYEVPDKSSQLNAIKEEMDYNDNLIDQLKELITLYDQLGDTGGIQKAANQIEELNKRQIELANSAQSIQEYKPNWDKFNEGADSFFNLTGSINGVVGSIDTLDKKIRDGANGWEVFMAAVSVTQGVLEGVQTVMTVVNAIQEVFNTKKAISAATSTTEAGAVTAAATAEQAKAAVDTGSIAAATASTAAVKAQEAALLDMAAAAIFAAHAFIPFAGVGIASGFIATMMATMTAQSAASLALAAFANGGIVGGGSSYGDQILARVNAGEMILNRRQQSNLFRAIESGDIGAGHTVLVPEFKIKGSDLYGTLRNFSKSVGKTGKVTGIR